MSSAETVCSIVPLKVPNFVFDKIWLNCVFLDLERTIGLIYEKQ